MPHHREMSHQIGQKNVLQYVKNIYMLRIQSQRLIANLRDISMQEQMPRDISGEEISVRSNVC